MYRTFIYIYILQVFSAVANIHSRRYGLRKVAHAQHAPAVRVCALYYHLKALYYHLKALYYHLKAL